MKLRKFKFWTGLFCLIASIFGLSSLLFSWMLERSLVEDVAAHADIVGSELEIIQSAADEVVNITEDRRWLGLHDEPGIVDWFLSPALAMLLKGEGDCGNMTFLLQQVLCHLDIKSVPALILDDDGKNIHVILRASTNQGEVFVDPLYAWMYLDNDGTPMAANDFTNEWRSNALNCKELGILNYPIVHGFAYTNWSSSGMLEGPVRWLFETMTGKKAEDISAKRYLPSWHSWRGAFFLLLGFFGLALGFGQEASILQSQYEYVEKS